MIPEFGSISIPNYYPEKKEEYIYSELQTRRWCVRNIKKDWNIFDIGAHIGTYSVLFGLLAPHGNIAAFEPTESAVMLQENVSANNISNVIIHKLALSDRSGKRRESIYKLWPADIDDHEFNFSTVDIQMKKIGWQRLDLIKIDVDSFDFEVLKGSIETIKKFNPWVLVELNHALDKRGYLVSDVLDWLASIGYSETRVLDRQNFLLKRDRLENIASSGSISVSFDHEIIYASYQYESAGSICAKIDSEPTFHVPKLKCNGSSKTSLNFNQPAWAYFMDWKVYPSATGNAVVEVDIDCRGGDIGVLCTDDSNILLGKEFFVAPGGEITARIFIDRVENLSHIIIRKGPMTPGETQFTHSEPKVFLANYKFGASSEAFDERISSISYEKIFLGLNMPKRPEITGSLNIVNISSLALLLGNDSFYVRPPESVLRNSLNEMPMESYDSKILAQIYRIVKPVRHLEFGTLEGFGTLLCLQNSDAHVWTINLPGGEKDQFGQNIYRNDFGELDAGESIGRLYREAGHSDRVSQILIDSRNFNHKQFDKGFFDSVLVDGGHAPEIVKSDTEKALYLCRPGGVIIWHDFCPYEEVYKTSSAALGVVEAVMSNIEVWGQQFSNIFWIRPSWILIGILKE